MVNFLLKVVLRADDPSGLSELKLVTDNLSLLNICIPKTLVNWINLTEFVTLPVQDERDLL